MSINTGDNFRYQGKKYLDDRQSFKTLAELMTYTNVPPGFIAYCEENGERYEYVNDTWILYKVSTDTGDLDLSDYALKTDVPTKTSELENDSGFVTQEHNHNANDIEGLDSAINEALNGASGGTSHVHSNLTTLEGISDEDINNWNNKSDFSGSYNELTNKPVIPTVPKHVSAFINDAGYISELPDMNNYATKDELHNHDNKATLDKLTEEKMTSWDNKSDFSGNYNDLSNKPITPTKTSQLINDSGFVTSDNIQNIDLDNYATKAELPTKLSQLENDSGYLKDADIHTHENKTVLDSITADKVNKWDNPNYNDLSNKPSIPNKVSQLTNDLEFVTREYMQNYVPDLSGVDLTIINEMLEGKFDDVMINDEESTDNQTAVDFYANEKVVKTLYLPKGGGGTTASAYISTTLPENVTIETGHDFELLLDFASPNAGRGTLKVFINDVDSLSTSINQGESTTVISNTLLTKGVNKMVVYVLDRRGVMSNSLTFYVRYGSTEITSTFDPYTAYDYGSVVRYYFTPTALDTSLSLTFYMKIDGETKPGVSCTSDVRSYYTFPNNLSVGKHYCEAWVNDGTNNSNVLKFNIIILDDTSLVVASDVQNATIEEGEQLALDYKVYMKNNTSFITKVYVDESLINTGTCGLETNYYRTTSLLEGQHIVRIEVWDVTNTVSDSVTWNITVTPSLYEMLKPVTTGSLFVGSAVNKSNADENKEVWIGKDQDNSDVTATLTNFSFNSENGWVDDKLIISGKSWVEVPVNPLANNARYGMTIDIEFLTKPIGVDNAEVLTLWNDVDNCGIKITTDKLIMRSKAGNKCELYFSENEVVSATFVIDRNEKVAKIYINGVMCEGFPLSDYVANGVTYYEDFTVDSNIFLGGYQKNGYCEIKNLRVYEIALATDEILNNTFSNIIDKTTQKAKVEFQKGDTLPTLTVYCDFSGLGKNDAKPCKITYMSPDVNLYGESFTLQEKNSTIQYQGTSSMAYPIKNYKIKLKKDGTGKKFKYNPFSSGQPESTFTLKADFMSSGHWQNTGLAKWISDNLYQYNTSDEKSMNPMKWYSIQNGGNLSDTRETINGFPCRLILINDGETPLNEGQNEPTPGNVKDMGIFNFNNDKGNTDTFGLDNEIFPRCVSYEVVANSDTSAGAFVPFNALMLFNESVSFANGTFSTSSKQVRTDYIDISTVTSGIVSFEITKDNIMCVCRYFDSDKKYLGSGNWDISGGRIIDKTKYSNIKYIILVLQEGAANGGVDISPKDIMSISIDNTEITTNNSKELAYLQDSFELRYPDDKEVGADYGMLGMTVDGVLSGEYGLKRVIDWVGNATNEEFVANFEQYFNKEYTFRYYLLVIALGMVDNLGGRSCRV